MPPYFDMTLLFEHERVQPNFVRDLYGRIIELGFPFERGCDRTQTTDMEEIASLSQELLDQGVHRDLRLVQVRFRSRCYSELRGMWMCLEPQVSFSLVIPEDDVLYYDDDVRFLPDRIEPMRRLAVELWESQCVDVIETTIEFDHGFHQLPSVVGGDGLSVRPFAIVPERIIGNFPSGFFVSYQTLGIGNGGVLVEIPGRMGQCSNGSGTNRVEVYDAGCR